ncbi:ribonuclease H-like domain-containing protein [Clostridium thermarum]|uniref:ribonuclease H-like domain-containing protein n=1 Tax=Clostridium thermarum TaxID=1716543 RepID=UPI001FAC4FB7|nr:ribonuclease H-like domain-containing protein [Clostridium thermarum]
MIVREKIIKVPILDKAFMFSQEGLDDLLSHALFFDLEHYVYKRPICIGVFGCCYYNESDSALKVTQYMIEKKADASIIVKMAKNYFEKALQENKTNIVTFSGNNDFTVINYLLNKYRIKLDFNRFQKIDIQNLFKKYTGVCTGLKIIEKQFNITRENMSISGTNLAKTFSKIMKDDSYINRMPKEKIEKILLYNQQDVVSLYEILANWNKYINTENREETC